MRLPRLAFAEAICAAIPAQIDMLADDASKRGLRDAIAWGGIGDLIRRKSALAAQAAYCAMASFYSCRESLSEIVDLFGADVPRRSN